MPAPVHFTKYTAAQLLWSNLAHAMKIMRSDSARCPGKWNSQWQQAVFLYSYNKVLEVKYVQNL